MAQPAPSDLPEPWLCGTLTEVPAVPRAVLHALELAKEDLWKWCFPLTDAQLNLKPPGLAPVAFHLGHIVGSLDRLLTYAEGRPLNPEQLDALKSEHGAPLNRAQLFSELDEAFRRSASRVRALSTIDFESPRPVGKKQLPSTLGGLLVHIAEHTLRHVGQAITTAKIVATP